MGAMSDLATSKVKSYWNRPGGKLGTMVALSIVAVAIFFNLEAIKNIVWNAVSVGIALGILGFLIFLVTDKKVRLAVTYIWDIIMKHTFGIIYHWDPFIVAEDNIKDMIKQREVARKQAIGVDTQKEAINMKINEKITRNKRAFAELQTAQKNNMADEAGSLSDELNDNKEYVEQLMPMLQSLTKLSEFLTKFDDQAGRSIKKAQRQLDLKKDAYTSLTKGADASAAVYRFFGGDPERKLVLQQSMDSLRFDMASKLANMKKAMMLSAGYMRSIDLEKATSQEEGMKLLETINPETDFALLEIDERQPVMAPGKVNTGFYDDLLKIK